jgi:hypothetical protein
MVDSAAHLVGPNGEVGPVEHPETGEITHYGPHSTQVVLPGGMIVKLTHGEGVMVPKDGAPAVILRPRKES